MNTTGQKTAQHTTPGVDRSSPAGPGGIAAAPPAYGIDFLDAGSSPPGARSGSQGGSTLQRKAGQARAEANPDLRPPNHTGLPDGLKSGVESLSGLSLDDVRVHRNSPQPARLSALAYTQGSEIHIAPGQERHIPHEAWHVVQQKQGRVKPTLSLHGTAINDDPGLEQEADRMGARAFGSGGTARRSLQRKAAQTGVAQGKMKADSFQELVKEQNEIYEEVDDWPEFNEGKYTTVGFEHEFAQMTSGRLRGVSHFEVSESHETLPPGGEGIPYALETDAQNALELVSPPFLIETLPNRPIPDADEVDKVDKMIRKTLTDLTAPNPTLEELVSDFKTDPGIDFPIKHRYATPKNMTPNSPFTVSWWDQKVSKKELKRIGLMTSEKGGGISTHVNFATDATTFERMQEINRNKGFDDDYTRVLKQIEADLHEMIYRHGMALEVTQVGGTAGVAKGHVDAAVDEARRVLRAAKTPIMEAKALEGNYAKRERLSTRISLIEIGIRNLGEVLTEIETQLDRVSISPHEQGLLLERFDQIVGKVPGDILEYNRYLGDDSVMQAVGELDTLVNLVATARLALQADMAAAAGSPNLRTFLSIMARTLSAQIAVPSMQALKKAQEKRFARGALAHFDLPYEQMITSRVKDVRGVWIKDSLINIGLGLLSAAEWGRVSELVRDADLREAIANYQLPPLPTGKQVPNETFSTAVLGALDEIEKAITSQKLDKKKTDRSKLFLGPKGRPDFMSHNPEWIGVRQDTYIPARGVQMPGIWKDRRLHVVESRTDTVDTLRKLKNLYEE